MYLQSTSNLLISHLNMVHFDWDLDNHEAINVNKRLQFIQEVLALGFEFSHELNQKLVTNNLINETSQFKLILNSLHDIKGDNLWRVKPLFKFPYDENVSNEGLLLLNSIYYVIANHLQVSKGLVKKEETFALHNMLQNNLPNITLSEYTTDDGLKFTQSFLTSNTIKSNNDRDLLRYILFDDKNLDNRIQEIDVDDIQLKENMVYLTSALMKNKLSVGFLKKYYTSPVDALRLAYNIAGKDIKRDPNEFYGDEVLRFKLTRPQIGMILSIIDTTVKGHEDALKYMNQHASQFKTLAQGIHPMTKKHQTRYPNAYKAFNLLMNNKIKGSEINKYYHDLFDDNKEIKLSELRKVAYARPTIFLKNLSGLLKVVPTEHHEELINILKTLVNNNEISPLALMQAYRYFANIDNQPLYLIQNRYYLGEPKKVNVSATEAEKIVEIIINGLSLLRSQNDNRKIYIDKSMYDIALPVNERETSTQAFELPKLSRLKIDSNFIRTFVYWQNGITINKNSRIDLDSSLMALGDNKTRLCSWDTSLKTEGMQHSGDITDANPQAIEYQDVDLNKLRLDGFKFLSLGVTSYTGQPFNIMNIAKAGFQGITSKQSLSEVSKIFSDDKHILDLSQNAELTSSATNIVVFIIDLTTNELIWLNSGYGTPLQYNSVARNETNAILPVIANTKVLTIGKLMHEWFKDNLITELPKRKDFDSDEEFNSAMDNITIYDNINTREKIPFNEIFDGLF